VGPNLKFCSWISLEELRRTARSVSKDSRSSGYDLNAGPLEYEAGMISIRPSRSWMNGRALLHCRHYKLNRLRFRRHFK
jgi:hypothetical protein